MKTETSSISETDLDLQKKTYPCYQCGICSGSCPVARLVDNFRPRLIVQETQFGDSKKLIESDVIWMCAACYNCYEHCPQGIKVTDVILELQSDAIGHGIIPKKFPRIIDAIYKNGLTNTLVGFQLKQREKAGLKAPPSPNTEAARKIIEETGLLSAIKKTGGSE